MFYKSKHFKSLIMAMIVMLLATGCGLKQGNIRAVKELKEPITLKYWRVFDGEDSFKEIIAAYHQLHPNVNIEYRKIRYEEYEKVLLEAWAEDRGPDIFSIHNTWMEKYQNKIEPMPDELELPYIIKVNNKTGDVEKAGYKKVRTLAPIDIKNRFADVVYGDVVRDNQVWGLPLSVDTLALFYNRSMLDNVGITEVPKTWLEVKEAVKKLTLQDEEGNIVQSGIALGGADNFNRAVDVLSLLMMQNGTEMVVRDRAVFDQVSSYVGDRNYQPGMEALRFYTDFAMPSKEVYTWDKEMPEATQAFITGKLAMMLGYSYQLPLIRAQGAKLNFGVNNVPHINADGTDATGNQINMASYWVETVSKKTEHMKYAWDFLQFASSEEQAIKYLTKTRKPTALRALINQQLLESDIKPFASQVLTAKSWYKGKNPLAMEEVFREMIRTVVEGKNTAADAIAFAAQRVSQTF